MSFKALSIYLAAVVLVTTALFPSIANATAAEVQFVEQRWTVDDGLPQNSILAIEQDEDGYMFLGTRAGLARFDGVRFTIFDSDNTDWLQDNFITALAAEPGVGLWIGTRNGLALLDRDHATTWTTDNGLPDSYIRSLHLATGGGVWVGTYGGGLIRLTSTGQAPEPASQGLPDLYVRALFESPDGTLWVGTDNGITRRRDGETWVFGPSEGLTDVIVRSLGTDSDGRLLAATEGGRVFRHSGERFEEQDASALSAGQPIHDLLSDARGDLWLATGSGLFQWRDGTLQRTQASQAGTVWALFEDREGSLWIGSQSGLRRLRVGELQTFDALDGETLSVRTVAEHRDGRILTGSDRNGIHVLQLGGLSRDQMHERLAGESIRALTFTSDGALWIGTRNGLIRSSGQNTRRLSVGDGLPSERINALALEPGGRLLVGTTAGLVRRTESGFELVDGLPKDLRVRSVLATERELWIGTEAGAYRVIDGEPVRFNTTNGLPHDFVLTIYKSSDGETWLGTAEGLAIVTGAEASDAGQQGLPRGAIYQILEGHDRALWLCTADGIWRIAPEDRGRIAAGDQGIYRPLRLAESEGMANRECNGGSQPAGAVLSDGRLAFPTVAGLTIVDPAKLRTTASAPKALLESFIVDGVDVDMHGEIEVPPRSRRFEFGYTAPTSRSPSDVRFRYLLEGFDEDWVPVGRRREAFFTNLEPGKYTFRIEAASETGTWGNVAELAFTLRPRFYQRIWFFPGLFVVMGLFGFGAFRTRVLRLRERQAELERLVSERTEELQVANETLEGLASVDALTGLANYRRFQEALLAEFGRARRNGRPLAMALFDIDFFKGFNDTFGHAKGDECLQRVAQTLALIPQRAGELIARYGGEEFVALLPETEETGVYILAERARKAVEEQLIPNPASDVSSFVTVSVGVTFIIPSDDDSPSAFFELADTALYEAKNSGRNRVVVRSMAVGSDPEPTAIDS